MNRMIAVCGLDCAACQARLATQANDEIEKERVAATWREMYKAPSIDAAYVTCDGCLVFDGHLGGHCLECEIRACGLERGLANCAHCADFHSCAKLAKFLEFVPDARVTLDRIRETL